MFTVYLSLAELVMCRMIGGMRSTVARERLIKDTKVSPEMGITLDEDGVIAEYAFCQKMNIFPDLVPSPRSGSADCLFMGKRIDIKSTRYRDGMLLATMKENPDVDIYVLAIVSGRKVVFPGFATKKQLINPDNITNLGHGEGYGLAQNQLTPWKEEYWDGTKNDIQ